MFYLKQYDTILLSFEIDDLPLEGQKCRILKINEDKKYLLPIGMKTDNDGLMRWLCSRIIPKNREYVDTLLSKNGLSHKDTRGILRISRGLSLNDCYWITEDSFEGSFAEYNLYEHDYVKVLSLIAYTGYGSLRASGFSSSPEFTTGGMLRKAWRWQKGKIMLYKGGTSGAANTGNEPFSEYYAAQIAKNMEINHIGYNLCMWKHSLCSVCELFCNLDTSYVPIYRFVENCNLNNVSEYLKELGSDFYAAFVDMLIFDCLIYNEDRHFGNFGLLVDNHSNKTVAFAPVFDNGLSLFNYGMPDDFDSLDEYSKTRMSSYGVSFEEIAGSFMTARQKEKLRKMIGFHFIHHSNYNLPMKRLRSIEKHLQKRVSTLLAIPEKS